MSRHRSNKRKGGDAYLCEGLDGSSVKVNTLLPLGSWHDLEDHQKHQVMMRIGPDSSRTRLLLSCCQVLPSGEDDMEE